MSLAVFESSRPSRPPDLLLDLQTSGWPVVSASPELAGVLGLGTADLLRARWPHLWTGGSGLVGLAALLDAHRAGSVSLPTGRVGHEVRDCRIWVEAELEAPNAQLWIEPLEICS